MPRPEPPKHSVHAVVIWPFVEAVRRLGMPELAGALPGAGERVPHAVASQLLDAAVQITGREDLGLLAAEAVEPGHFELVELASRAQRSVGEGLSTLAPLAPILHDGLSLELVRGEPLSVLRVALAPGLRVHPAGYDFIVATLVIAGRRQTGLPALCPSYVRLPYPRPLGSPPLARLLDCELGFDHAALEIGFARERLELPLRRADASLGQVLEQAARELLPQDAAQGKLASALRALLRENLAGGAPDASTLARKLHMSERTLRRKLEAEGIGLRALIDDVRKELALEKLADDTRSTEAIAAELGFTTAQALHRAFRRWTGGTVQAHRARAAAAPKRGRPS